MPTCAYEPRRTCPWFCARRAAVATLHRVSWRRSARQSVLAASDFTHLLSQILTVPKSAQPFPTTVHESIYSFVCSSLMHSLIHDMRSFFQLVYSELANVARRWAPGRVGRR